MANVGVDCSVLESLLQVLIDGLFADLGQQRQVGDSNLSLLARLEGGLFDSLRSLGRLRASLSSSSSSFGDSH